MQPTPTKADIPICDEDARACYLWIHLPQGPGRIITFPSIKQAYAFAEKYVLEDNASPLLVRRSAFRYRERSCDTTWTSADGVKWISPTMTWDNTLYKIYIDIQSGKIPEYKQWMTVFTTKHQMIIGLDSDLPETCRQYTGVDGYTLEAHDKPEDMPPLLWSPYNEYS